MSAPSTAVRPDGSPADLAVVLVNFRMAPLVERCVRSVQRTRGSIELEVVIVDNGSADGSAAALTSACPDADVVALDQNGGFAAGVNAGFGRSRSPLVLVLNPDTEVRPGAVEALVERLRRHPRTAVAAPLLEHPGGELQAGGYRRFPRLLTLFVELCIPVGYLLVHAPRLNPYALSPGRLRSGARPAHVYGAAMAIRRQAYEEAGPFDEGFFLYMEETEWQERVRQRGWEIEIVPSARVCHLVRGGGDSALAPSPHFLESALRYLQLHHVPRAVSRAVLAVALALSWMTLNAISLLPAKRATARKQAQGYATLLRQAVTGAAPRRPEARVG